MLPLGLTAVPFVPVLGQVILKSSLAVLCLLFSSFFSFGCMCLYTEFVDQIHILFRLFLVLGEKGNLLNASRLRIFLENFY